MTFSDDDLKRLKEGYWFHRVPINNIGQSESWVWCDGDKVLALLARLEAAEKALDLYAGMFSTYGESYEAYKDWRKAAGK